MNSDMLYVIFLKVYKFFKYNKCKYSSNVLILNHNLHIHFAIGTTNVNTGKKYYTDMAELIRFRNHTEAVLNEMGISNDYLSLKFG